MPDNTMNIEDYLAQGGVLSAPGNTPARYRAELMRLMASFVDSELAASAGFASSINFAPAIKERIAASRITLEKADHAERVLAVMGDFGTDTARYQVQHDWAKRVARDADIGLARQSGDMRLSVFHYPITGWVDAVVMNVLQGLATKVQMGEFTRLSYGPLAEVFREIAPREARHMELGLEALEHLAQLVPEQVQEAVTYWHPRVAAGFGNPSSARFEMLQKFGLRRRSNEALLAEWSQELDAQLAKFGLK